MELLGIALITMFFFYFHNILAKMKLLRLQNNAQFLDKMMSKNESIRVHFPGADLQVQSFDSVSIEGTIVVLNWKMVV